MIRKAKPKGKKKQKQEGDWRLGHDRRLDSRQCDQSRVHKTLKSIRNKERSESWPGKQIFVSSGHAEGCWLLWWVQAEPERIAGYDIFVAAVVRQAGSLLTSRMSTTAYARAVAGETTLDTRGSLEVGPIVAE